MECADMGWTLQADVDGGRQHDRCQLVPWTGWDLPGRSMWRGGCPRWGAPTLRGQVRRNLLGFYALLENHSFY